MKEQTHREISRVLIGGGDGARYDRRLGPPTDAGPLPVRLGSTWQESSQLARLVGCYAVDGLLTRSFVVVDLGLFKFHVRREKKCIISSLFEVL